MTSSQRPLNQILLMADQLRADHVSWHPGSPVSTPNLERLAEGTVFDQCITVNPYCTPARCALLTGRYTRQIGMIAMAGDLDPRHGTQPRAQQQAGWWTSAVGKLHWWQGWPWSTPRGVGHQPARDAHLTRLYGFDHVWEVAGKQLAVRNDCDYCEHLRAKGVLERFRDHVEAAGQNFDHVDRNTQELSPWPLSEEDYPDVLTATRICEAIRSRPKDRPFFLFGSFCSPHQPFDPPRRFLDRFPLPDLSHVVHPGEQSEAQWERLRRLERGYRAMTSLVDEQVGRVLDCLEQEGLLDETVVMFSADHGDMMGDHGRMQKGDWHDGSLRVPTAIRHPQHLRRARCSAPVEIIDLTATLLDCAGLDPVKALGRPWPGYCDRIPARSLMPTLRGEGDPQRDWAFSECKGSWECIRSRRFTYVREIGYQAPGGLRERLIDREADPTEALDRAADPAFRAELDWHRQRRDFVADRYLPCQARWAPCRDPGYQGELLAARPG